jgi:acyl carrier protein
LLPGATEDTARLLTEFGSIVQDVTGQDPRLRPDTQITDLGIESLVFFEVIGELERRFDVQFTVDDLAAVRTVGDLLQLATAPGTHHP